jgi:hypothetical protein
MFLGEGSTLYQCGIPSISLVPGPDYLCQILPGGGLDRLDKDFAQQQVASFSQALRYLDAAPSEVIGPVAPTWDRPGAMLRHALSG